MNKPNTYIIIPARLESKRFPGKLLKNETGKTLLQHTVELALQCVDLVYVATSDEEIYETVKDINADVRRNTDSTRKMVICVKTHECDNGTERAALAVMALRKSGGVIKDEDIIVILQADEPEINRSDLDLFIHNARESCGEHVWTMASKTQSVSDDPNVVKVVVDRSGCAKYFSRLPLPGSSTHIGIYAASVKSLIAYYQTPVCKIEEAENLEQLRWVYSGGNLSVRFIHGEPHSINTEEDYKAFVERWNAKNEKQVEAIS